MQVARRAHLEPFLSCSGPQGTDLLPTHHKTPWPSGFQWVQPMGYQERDWRKKTTQGRGWASPLQAPALLAAVPGPSHTVSLASVPQRQPLPHPFTSSEEPGVPHQARGILTPRSHVSGESFIKLCSNYPILNVPSASCWDPDSSREAE